MEIVGGKICDEQCLGFVGGYEEIAEILHV
jgi:hypothetical protein